MFINFIPGGGFASESDMYIPFSTFRKLYNTGDNVGWFVIAAYDDADVIKAEKDVKAVLKNIHRVDPDDERAFGAYNLGEIFNKIMGFAKGLTFLSLIVGFCDNFGGGYRYWEHIIDIRKRENKGIGG